MGKSPACCSTDNRFIYTAVFCFSEGSVDCIEISPCSVKNKHSGLLYKLEAKILILGNSAPKLIDRSFNKRSYQSEAQTSQLLQFHHNSSSNERTSEPVDRCIFLFGPLATVQQCFYSKRFQTTIKSFHRFWRK